MLIFQIIQGLENNKKADLLVCFLNFYTNSIYFTSKITCCNLELFGSSIR
ncbi:MAG: hypothetical protein RJA76_207 [Bacteroidota bacterium]|jgi:hypothetical protein